MRKTVLLIGIAALIILSGTACLKNSSSSICANKSVTDDEPAILAYLSANNITGYVKHSSGLYYKIDNPGSGVTPNASSKVYVTYTGRFTDNTVFDSLGDASKSGWVLGTLVPGWQIGLPLVSKGGRIELFIPSALGYGCKPVKDNYGNTVIPGNAILVFNVELTDVQ
jgi:FKBP-type peptidyl-prolyl cis-trans isomerase FkpA